MERFLLGVDTGGTYTDAVALSAATGEVMSAAKALTTRADLATGIGQAIAGLQRIEPGAVALVCLSTTLATNAIVEGHGGRVCLVLIGYDPELIDRFGFQRDLVVEDAVHVAGGHDIYGLWPRGWMRMPCDAWPRNAPGGWTPSPSLTISACATRSTSYGRATCWCG